MSDAPPDALNFLPDYLSLFADVRIDVILIGMTDNLKPLRELALRHGRTGMTLTPIPRLEIGVRQATSGTSPCLYRSMICFILQGSKEVVIHDSLLRYDASQYLVSALDLPLSGQIHDADDGSPYVSVSLVLDAALLAEVASTMPAVRDADAPDSGIATNPMTPPLRDTLLRLLALLDTPADIPALAPMAERELLYRLLQGPQGRLLRHIARPEGAIGRIRRAVEWIRDHGNTRLRIDALCEAAGMSRASLHRHFVALTGLSPIQYQKQLRLQEARQLLLAGDRSASDVAYAVGYESASQFSREYLRQFGAPPARDVRKLRQSIDNQMIN